MQNLKRTYHNLVTRALGSLLVSTLSSHWLFRVFFSLLFGCCDSFGFGFTTRNRKALYSIEVRSWKSKYFHTSWFHTHEGTSPYLPKLKSNRIHHSWLKYLWSWKHTPRDSIGRVYVRVCHVFLSLRLNYVTVTVTGVTRATKSFLWIITYDD